MSVNLLHGDAAAVLATLPDGAFHTCVTSPPYYGLRSYLPDDHPDKELEIGLEQTPDEYISRLVAVFREVRRVLRDDGTLWVNIGDSYASTPPGNKTVGVSAKSGLNGVNGESGRYRETLAAGHATKRDTSKLAGIKPKDLIGIPWLLAFALRADGWYLRSEIIWAKRNCMPESVKDRPTRAHETLFLLTKRPTYFYDSVAIEEAGDVPAGTRAAKGSGARGAVKDVNGRPPEYWEYTGRRNKRTVWTMATKPFKEAHFACVDADTECLTATGWKRHADIRPGMLAAQFDMSAQRLSWAPVETVARYSVTDQEMVVGSCRDMDMWLTPNHRTVIQRRHPRSRHLQAPLIVHADELLASHNVPTAAEWEFIGDATVPLEWAELLGWYVAEGHESKDSLAVELYQSESANSAKCGRIEELLRQTGAEWTKATCKRIWRGRAADLTAYRILGYSAVRLREMAPAKKLPWACTLWSADRIEALLAGMIAGDGHVRQDGRQCFVQKDNEQCGLVQALAMRLGMSATMSVRRDGIGVVYLTKHQTRSFRGKNGAGSAPSRRLYTGIVWCPKLPVGTWVARRNGKPFITGNTFPPELPETCIRAGTSERGCCPGCGAPWGRQVERVDLGWDGSKYGERALAAAGGAKTGGTQRSTLGSSQGELVGQSRTTGWAQPCSCAPIAPIPCRVLDPFAGAGTTGLVADRLRRDATLIDLSDAYQRMQRDRIAGDAPLLTVVA